MNEVRRFQLKCLMAIAALAIVAASTAIWAGDEPENPRPAESRTSGNTWCGPVFRSGNDPLYVVYGELAKYVDVGAIVVGHSQNVQIDEETFVLCGKVRGRPTN